MEKLVLKLLRCIRSQDGALLRAVAALKDIDV